MLRLLGQARETARTLTDDELRNGGEIRGVHQDPLTYILVGLQQRYGQFGDESRLAAMVEYQAFERRQGEGINQLLDRYDVVRARAENEGNFVQSTEGCAMTLLKCTNCNPQQFIQYLHPFGGRLPHNEWELRELQANMRRIGHILEHTPNNIGQSLNNPRQARVGAYPTTQATRDAFEESTNSLSLLYTSGKDMELGDVL